MDEFWRNRLQRLTAGHSVIYSYLLIKIYKIVICVYVTYLLSFYLLQLEFVISTMSFYHCICKVMKNKQKPSHEIQHTTSTQHTHSSHLASALQLFKSSTS
jgi:hypothetical protein